MEKKNSPPNLLLRLRSVQKEDQKSLNCDTSVDQSSSHGQPFTIEVASCDTSYTAPNSVAKVAAFATTITVKTESIHRQMQIIFRKAVPTHLDMLLIKAAS